MTLLSAATPSPTSTARTDFQPSLGLMLVAAWLLVMVQLLLQYWATTAIALNDTDDAMRLVQMREFLNGRGWFDLRVDRAEPPHGYESHWSRLIDAGMAGMYLVFRLFADDAMAERLMRAFWPMLWLLPAMGAVAAIAHRIAGRDAAIVAMVLSLVALPAMEQFLPGRVDHHNAQIALSLVLVAAIVWSDLWKLGAMLAGLTAALMLAIGLECLPFVVVGGAALALRYVLDATAGPALARFGIAFSAGMAAMFLVSVAPSHWGRSVCDALAINMALPAALAGGGLALAVALTGTRGPALRLVGMLAVGTVGLALFALIAPQCLRGPFADLNPALRPIWLDQVREVKPFLHLIAEYPVSGLGLAIFPVFGLIACAMLATGFGARRGFALWTATAALLVAVAVTLSMTRAYAYAMWLAMPLVAALVRALYMRLNITKFVARAVIALLFTPTILSVGVIMTTEAAGLRSGAVLNSPQARACFSNANFAGLAALPKGIVAADIDVGPFLLALTPHTVLGAPYHRMSAGIIASHDVFVQPPEVSRRILADFATTYLVVCKGREPANIPVPVLAASLWRALETAQVPDWLEPLPQASGAVFAVYRIRR